MCSYVTDMKRLFEKSTCNEDLSTWDMSNVTNMHNYMFCFAEAFKQPIGGWDVSKVEHMQGIFFSAAAFN